MANLTVISGMKSAPKSVRSQMDTVLITPDVVAQWKVPPFQRPLRVNDKVRALSEELKHNGGVMPGVITLGRIGGTTYIVDGQHRREAFILATLPEAYADVRLCDFDSLADMGEEFVKLNQAIVRMRPDDILRGLEGVIPGLSALRKACPYVSYDQVRRGDHRSPVVSMSAVLRCWSCSRMEVPASSSSSAVALARDMPEEEWRQLTKFLDLAHGSWGRDPEYYRLWGTLNMTICMWLYRRTVIGTYSGKSVRLTTQQFSRCLMALSASEEYLSWLVGRNLSERDRSPCYGRVRSVLAKRLAEEEPGKQLYFPSPAWFTGKGGHKGTGS